MNGLYLNIPKAAEKINYFHKLLRNRFSSLTIRHHYNWITVDYHRTDWPEGPVYRREERGIVAIASGWLMYRGKLGNLNELANDLYIAHDIDDMKEVMASVDAGAFIILLFFGDRKFIITDPFGLHPHYTIDSDHLKNIAPSPTFLKEGLGRVPQMLRILKATNHLFGNWTAYQGVKRLEPGAIIVGGKHIHYFDYSSLRMNGDKICRTISGSLDLFGSRKRILPISGGLDSRLILALGDFDFGYTFGPENTGDRPVARKFSKFFRDYLEFSLLDLDYPEDLWVAGSMIFDGICSRPFLELLGVYRYIYNRWGDDCCFFDAYLGDVFTRGSYLKCGGIRGSLEKLFPSLSLRKFDALNMLRRRYESLAQEDFDQVARLYRKKTGRWNLDPMHKLMLFEILYGRGGRYILNGGTVMSSQYFSVVQPFFIPAVFRVMFGISAYDAMSYRILPNIWRRLPKEFLQVTTYSGFKPTWSHHLSRSVHLMTKGLGKTGIYKRALSYEKELSHIEWRS